MPGGMTKLARTPPTGAVAPRRIAVDRDIAFGPLPDQRMDIYRPEGAAGLPAIVFFHGGSWRSGSRRHFRILATELASAGTLVAVPDYRLFPAVTYPAFLTDCADATAWAARHAPGMGAAENLFIMGHSAGAYNAMMLGLDPAWLHAAGCATDIVTGVIGISGPYDFPPLNGRRMNDVFPAPGPESQPIHHARPDAPPLLLVAGADDQIVKPRHTAALAARVLAVGGRVETVTYPGLGHLGPATSPTSFYDRRGSLVRDVMAFVERVVSELPPRNRPAE
jgi:acetyl esterase/lipase